MTTRLKLYNTLTREKVDFSPIDPSNVRMYVCGPTVYDFAHIGNARPVIVFDVLYRLLRHVYGENHVTYVRNITDVDDKINARALRDFPELPLNDAIRKVTEKTANQFHQDVKALGCLEPTFEPRATEHIDGMVRIIQQLIDRGHAYVASGNEGREVLFAVGSMKDYGKLSGRKLEDQQAGARIAVEAHKRNPGDFVLWKESAADQPGWPASFRENGAEVSIFGRPGWHIECSAMSQFHLGETFDIHGGGLDLIFPHHENEIAQSRCAHGTDVMANVWMHNGFLQVEGKKMSKSDGNFVTIHELLHTDKFGGRKWHAQVVRLAMMKTHYASPIDWTVSKLEEAERELDAWSQFSWDQTHLSRYEAERASRPIMPVVAVIEALSDDLNMTLAISSIHQRRKLDPQSYETLTDVLDSLEFLGIVRVDELGLFGQGVLSETSLGFVENQFELVRAYRVSLANHDSEGANAVISAFRNLGVGLQPGPRLGNCGLTFAESFSLPALINERLAFLASKNFTEADRIRNELLEQGIQLKDSKDPVTGERVTTWEVKR